MVKVEAGVKVHKGETKDSRGKGGHSIEVEDMKVDRVGVMELSNVTNVGETTGNTRLDATIL